MVAPIGATTFREALRTGTEVYHSLKSVLKSRASRRRPRRRGRRAEPRVEPRRARPHPRRDRAGRLRGRHRRRARARRRGDGVLQGRRLPVRGPCAHTPDEMVAYYSRLVADYPLVSIEDPLSEDEWGTWSRTVGLVGDKVQIVGDDLFVTNPERLAKGIENKAANSLLVKAQPDRHARRTLDAVTLAQRNGFTTMTSHRSTARPRTPPSPTCPPRPTRSQIKTSAPAMASASTSTTRSLLRIEEESWTTLAAATPGVPPSRGSARAEPARTTRASHPTRGPASAVRPEHVGLSGVAAEHRRRHALARKSRAAEAARSTPASPAGSATPATGTRDRQPVGPCRDAPVRTAVSPVPRVGGPPSRSRPSARPSAIRPPRLARSSAAHAARHPEDRARAGVPHRLRYSTVRVLVFSLVLLLAFVLVYPTLRSTAATARLAEAACAGRRRRAAQRRPRGREGRWDDPAYVAAQARERLSFVLPGEGVPRPRPRVRAGHARRRPEARRPRCSTRAPPGHSRVRVAGVEIAGTAPSQERAPTTEQPTTPRRQHAADAGAVGRATRSFSAP